MYSYSSHARRLWIGVALALLGLLLSPTLIPRPDSSNNGLVQAQLAPYLIFSATIRDMPQLHPDFEAPYAADFQQTGMVMNKLNPSNFQRPMFVPSALRTNSALTAGWYNWSDPARPPPAYNYSGNIAIANQGHFFFDEYYMDLPGVNVAFNVSLNFTLNDTQNGLYVWDKPMFFPLDGQAYGKKEGYMVTDPTLAPMYRDGQYHNFWFTTQMRLNFYYRGGEIFMFNGDDDMWVFVDGNLTSCDLGGIHPEVSCYLNLDTLGLQPNTQHELEIFHAERHTDSSQFSVTTSVKPINHPPTVGNVTAATRLSLPVTIKLQGFDTDNDILTFIVTTPPLNGTLSNTTLAAGASQLTYTPDGVGSGADVFTYTAFDGQANATNVGFVTVNVLPNPRAPVPQNVNLNVTVGDTVWIPLVADSLDTPASALTWYLTANPQFGYARIEASNSSLWYQAVNPGQESFTFRVADNLNNGNTGTASGTVWPKPAGPVAVGLSPPVVTAIVLGSVAGASAIGIGLAYLFYNRYMAAKFAATWQEEWMRSNIRENPLFVSNVKEQFNPLYRGAR